MRGDNLLEYNLTIGRVGMIKLLLDESGAMLIGAKFYTMAKNVLIKITSMTEKRKQKRKTEHTFSSYRFNL